MNLAERFLRVAPASRDGSPAPHRKLQSAAFSEHSGRCGRVLCGRPAPQSPVKRSQSAAFCSVSPLPRERTSARSRRQTRARAPPETSPACGVAVPSGSGRRRGVATAAAAARAGFHTRAKLNKLESPRAGPARAQLNVASATPARGHVDLGRLRHARLLPLRPAGRARGRQSARGALDQLLDRPARRTGAHALGHGALGTLPPDGSLGALCGFPVDGEWAETGDRGGRDRSTAPPKRGSVV
eukprot:scaffold788_cov231-Pinguiococcus_pyrenoidosus.AAC.2